MKTRAPMRYYFTLKSLTKIEESHNIKCRWGQEETQHLRHCWWKYNLANHSRKQCGLPGQSKMYISHDLAVSFKGDSLNPLYTCTVRQVLFAITKYLKQLTYLPVGECIYPPCGIFIPPMQQYGWMSETCWKIKLQKNKAITIHHIKFKNILKKTELFRNTYIRGNL